MTRSTNSLAGLALIAVAATPAAATLIVPMHLRDLAASSEIAVAGTVAAIDHLQLADGRLVTRVAVDVEESWKGEAPSPLPLIELGGDLGDVAEVVFGSPSYELGEPVVVFATRTPIGWRTNHMLQGKFRIAEGPDGVLSATRSVEPGIAVLSGNRGAWRPSIPLDELRAVATSSPTAAARLSALPFEELEIVDQVESRFTTQNNNPRFFEADEGRSLDYLIDDRGDSILGLETSRRAVNEAMAAWNAVSGTSLELRDVGTTNDIGVTPIEGVHRILFDDPGDEISDPFNCSGTLGVGGSRLTPSEQKTFGGRTFSRILSSNIKFADNWDGCPQWDECNFSEVAAHEGGHAFGLGHSSENPNEGIAELRDALMYFRAHFDLRCASPRDDDMAGIRAIYPEETPATITTQSPLPEGIMGESYRLELQTIGATPPLSWRSIGQGCPDIDDIPGLGLTPEGVLQGTLPQFVDDRVETCLTIEVTDADGESHSKRLGVVFVRQASPDTPTPTHTGPAATATHTPTATVPANRPCVGDCNHDGRIVINELIRGVNIALGNAEVESCPSFDRDGGGVVSVAELIASVSAALFGCTS